MTPNAVSPAMLRKPPAGAMLPLLLIFICGVAVGALAMSLVIHNTIHRSANLPDNLNRATVEKWKKELNLSAAQQREMESTLDDLTKYYRNVLSDGKDRILSILDEGQRRKFQRLLEEKRK